MPPRADRHGYSRRLPPDNQRQAHRRLRHAAGPGSENAFPGAAQAFADNVPLLLLLGGYATSRSFVSPDFSAIENYEHVTKWQAQVADVQRIPELMRRAFYQLRTGKGGPVLLEVPTNVWTADFDGKLD